MILFGILLIAGVSGLFYIIDNTEGSIIGDGSNCQNGYFTPTHPDSREPYTSKDGLRQDVSADNPEWNETRIDRYMDNAELRITENGTVVQLQEVCS